MKILDYFYYTFYKFTSKNPRNDIAEHTAYMIFSLVILTNILVVSKKNEINLLSIFNSKLVGMMMCFPIMLLFYFVFAKNDRYKEIIKRFSQETRVQKWIRNIIVWGYVLFTIWGLLIT